ncbi:GAF domain-containing protein [Gordonia sp. 'Campus']|uniref:GAF domain-containing protein n=1 Tax=Gordonia sp. 'Campus' TaxID=2915824 RepID=UPI001EE3B28E|nr:GAF domain-containing protein [Gordonia sp. 'Campus']
MSSNTEDGDAMTGADDHSRDAEAPTHDADQLAAFFEMSPEAGLHAVLEAVRGRNPEVENALRAILADPERMRALKDSGLLDDPPTHSLDETIRLTIDAVGVPHVAVNVITPEEQATAAIAFRSGQPEGPSTRSLVNSLCVLPVVSGSPLIIDDIADHALLADHPTATSGEVTSYLGIPIADDDGHVIGTFCAWDSEPHHWSSAEVQLMSDLSVLVRELIFGR